MTNAVTGVADKIRSVLHFSVPDEGPLSDADEYMPDFMKLLATGIKKNVRVVVKAVRGLASSMSDNLTTPADSLSDWIYCAFIESGVLQGDVATYKTNFGVTLTSKGNRRTLTSFMGYKRSDLNGNVVYIDAPYKVYGFSIQYRRYLTTAAKRERKEAV